MTEGWTFQLRVLAFVAGQMVSYEPCPCMICGGRVRATSMTYPPLMLHSRCDNCAFKMSSEFDADKLPVIDGYWKE